MVVGNSVIVDEIFEKVKKNFKEGVLAYDEQHL